MARSFFSRFTRARERHITVFDGQDLRRACMAGYAWLEQHREAVNALNVFPVPDGDTGTNMSLTMRAATDAIANEQETSAGVVAEQLSRGALMGARGNSGVILSQILRGLGHGLDGKATFTAGDFADGLQEAARMAYRAVIKPVEGTILTVIRECADAARQSAARHDDITALLDDTVRAAQAAVARTPDLLPTLKQAGVVDAGGQGLALILEGIARYARGQSIELTGHERGARMERARRGQVSIEGEDYGYEVVFMLGGEHLDVERIRDTITAMGGVSTVVAGDARLLKVHTHTPTPGKILDYGVSLGTLEGITIENMQVQSRRYAEASARERAGAAPREHAMGAPGPSGTRTVRDVSGYEATGAPGAEPLPQPLSAELGTVVVVSGDGWVNLYHSLGVTVIVPGGQTMNPSTQELLEAVERCPSRRVLLLPNNGNVLLSAQQAARLSDKEVYVIPSETLPQGVSALLALNYEATFDTNRQAMEAAVRRIHTVAVTRAVRDAEVDGVAVRAGDIIGLINGHLATAGQALEDVVRDALARANVGACELFTIYYGDDTTREQAEALAERIKGWYSEQELEIVEGGQPFYPYIISAE